MTMIFLVSRPPYAVLAADRLWHQVYRENWREETSGFFTYEERRERWEHTKIGLHPTLPMAWATTGPGMLAGKRAHELVGDVLSNVRVLDDARAPLVQLLGPTMAHEMNEGEYGAWPDHEASLGVAIAQDANGQITAAQLDVNRTGECKWQDVSRGGWLSPAPGSESFFGSQAQEDIFGVGITDPHKLVRHVRRIMRDGIAEGERVLGDKAASGAGVDVVLLTPTESRLFSAGN